MYSVLSLPFTLRGSQLFFFFFFFFLIKKAALGVCVDFVKRKAIYNRQIKQN